MFESYIVRQQDTLSQGLRCYSFLSIEILETDHLPAFGWVKLTSLPPLQTCFVYFEFLAVYGNFARRIIQHLHVGVFKQS